MPEQKPELYRLAENWPAPFIARECVHEFSGGLVNRRTLANLDSKGEGPRGKFRIGRKVGYPVKDFVDWLQSRAN